MNSHPECLGCEYNTPKTKGGQGRICNGYTQPTRCPEWVIHERQKQRRKEEEDGSTGTTGQAS